MTSHSLNNFTLRVVPSHYIFLQSMSEKIGFDIERLWNSMTSCSIDFQAIEICVIIKDPESFYVGADRLQHWFQNVMILVWTTLNEQINVPNLVCNSATVGDWWWKVSDILSPQLWAIFSIHNCYMIYIRTIAFFQSYPLFNTFGLRRSSYKILKV